MKGFATWILSKQTMLFFLFGLLFILLNFVFIVNNAFKIMEANNILSKIEDSYSQVLFINVKSIVIKLPSFLLESISEKTDKYSSPYKLYIEKNKNFVYFIISTKEGKNWRNITGTSLSKNNHPMVFVDCSSKGSFESCLKIENDRVKKIDGIQKGNLLIFDSKINRYISIKKINNVIYILIL